MSPASKKTTSRIIRLKVPQRAGKSTRAPKGTKSLKGTKSSKGPKSLKGPKPQKTAKVAKAPKVAKPPKKRRFSDTSSSLDLSSDGGYSELEDADDSDDEDEDDVEAAEAEHYTTRDTGELLRDDHVASSSSRPRLSEDEDAENSDDDDDDPSVDVNLVEGTDSEDDQPNSDDAEDSPEWAGFQSDMDESVSEQPILKPILNQDPPKDERRVRFAVPSDSDDTDDDEEMLEFFPDIFIAQEALDSNFRREIEEDPDDSSNSGTYWDYSNGQEANPWFVDSDVEVFQNPSYATTPVATPLGSQYSADFDFTKASNDVTGFEEFEGLDGYESELLLRTAVLSILTLFFQPMGTQLRTTFRRLHLAKSIPYVVLYQRMSPIQRLMSRPKPNAPSLVVWDVSKPIAPMINPSVSSIPRLSR